MNMYHSTDYINTEKEAIELLKKLFIWLKWDFREQFETKSGKLIDFVVKAPYDDGHIFFGVECKRRMNDRMTANELSDYLEQSSAYARDLNMPVFIGPAISHKRGHKLYAGGVHLSAIAAFNIFAGRQNVGMLVCNPHITKYRPTKWSMVLRGTKFWDADSGFNPQRLYMVCSTGSKMERKPLKIWKRHN